MFYVFSVENVNIFELYSFGSFLKQWILSYFSYELSFSYDGETYFTAFPRLFVLKEC